MISNSKYQIRSAAISVMSNIPEGYERDSKIEFSHFEDL
jgi:four helix bundle protein